MLLTRLSLSLISTSYSKVILSALYLAMVYADIINRSFI